jgi:hypothetical protein
VSNMFTVPQLEGGAPEVEVSRDIIRRGIIVAPVLIGICAAIWGWHGAVSSLYAIALVLVNFALAAAIMMWTAKISLPALLGGVLFGYLLRLGVIFVAVFLVRNASWISLPAVGTSIIVTHLGLLIWELRHVSMSLAYPGLKPKISPRPFTSPN